MKMSFRRPKVLGFCLLCLWLHRASASDFPALKTALEEEIRKEGVEAFLALKDLGTGRSLFLRENEMVHAASTMKVPVMIEVFRQAEAGKFGLDDRLVVRNEFRSLADGSPFSLSREDDSDQEIYDRVGTEMTLRELTERMITVSSNLATNILVDLVKAENVMETLRRLGIEGMEVLRGVEDGKAFEKGLNNRTSALGLMRVMEEIALGRAASRDSCREMIEILARQKFREGIPSGIPSGVNVANKTGSITGMEHDAAIVFPPGRKPYVLAILSRGVKSREAGEALIARLSRLIYGELAKTGTRPDDPGIRPET